MQTTGAVARAIRTWKPNRRFRKEQTVHNALLDYLRTEYPNTPVETESHGQVDIRVGSDTGIEIKHDPGPSELDRLSGQLDRYQDEFRTVIVFCFGEPHQSRWAKLTDNYRHVTFIQMDKDGTVSETTANQQFEQVALQDVDPAIDQELEGELPEWLSLLLIAVFLLGAAYVLFF